MRFIWLFLLSLCATWTKPQDLRSKSTCNSPEVNEGDTGVIEFLIRQNINFDTAADLHFYITKENTSRNIFQCIQSDQASRLDCSVEDDRFESKGLDGRNVILRIPNITREMQGQYVLQLTSGGQFDPPITCQLDVQQREISSTGGSANTLITAALSTCFSILFLIVVICILVFMFRKWRRHHRAKERRSREITTIEDRTDAGKAWRESQTLTEINSVQGQVNDIEKRQQEQLLSSYAKHCVLEKHT